MKLSDIALALFVVVIWGLAFPAIQFALTDFTPAQLAALRFGVAALPVFVLPRPRMPLTMLVAIGATLFLLLFVLQFYGFAAGIPAGMAAVLVQTQVPLTVLLAAVSLRERPTARQIAGIATSFAGLALIASNTGQGGVTLLGFGLMMLSALSWAVANILIKRAPRSDALSLVSWASLVPVLPCLVLSAATDGPAHTWTALSGASWAVIAAIVYLAFGATNFGYGAWAALLARYTAAQVTPFALLVPCVAAAASWLIYGEVFAGRSLAGAILVMAGLAVIVIPWDRLRVRRY